MNVYETLAEQMLLSMDKNRHFPPEPVSGSVRGEMAVLRLLSCEGDGRHAGDIAAALQMTTSRIAAVLNALEKKALITRLVDSADKRRVLVYLTQEGKENCLRRRSEARAQLAGLLSLLCEEDAATYVRLTEQLFSHPCNLSPDKEV